MEIWDAYDAKFSRIDGISLVRGEPIPNGCFHLVSEIVVKHDDGSYLLMQRDKRKHLGGMWEATAGGSALRGEAQEECARRELREETGILSDDLTEVGRVISRDTIYVEFLCVADVKKDVITLQDGETIAFMGDSITAGGKGMKGQQL